MSLLQALDRYYDRLADIAEPGWAPVKFGWCVVLAADGTPVDVTDLHDNEGKKARPREFIVPAVARTSGIKAALLWDKTAYALGRTAGEGRRTAEEHAAFKAANLALIGDSDDAGLVALRRFLERWQTGDFNAPPFRPEMLDANLMFRLDGDVDPLHQRPAARQRLAAALDGRAAGAEVFCLVTGERGPGATLHPAIKDVNGAQSSGAYIVSFNQPAFASYGNVDGANAPTSERAAFRYGTALNRLLARGGPNRLARGVGDATVVFWADASDAVAAAAESFFNDGLDTPTDAAAAKKLGDDLAALAQGRPLSSLGRGLEDGTRFHVLGLSPNAARLSVRFYLTDTLDAFARRLADHAADLALQPPPWQRPPALNLLLAKSVALMEKFDNVPPLLAGEVTRAILTGGPYPRSWLAGALMRLRAGDAMTGWHIAAIRAVLARGQRLARRHPDIPEQGETPMSLKRDHPNPGYQLGRLFAVYELAQRSALGRINATIRDKYFGAASATPASIFPVIVRNAQNHLARVRKDKPGWAALIERELEEIHGWIEPRLPLSLPRSLSLQNQGEFAIGYYHQRAAKLSDATGVAISLAETDAATETQGDDA